MASFMMGSDSGMDHAFITGSRNTLKMIDPIEDMLMLELQGQFKGNWDEYLPLAEFTYNNSYHSSIGMSPYEALYGRQCWTPLHWNKIGERKLLGPEIVHAIVDKVNITQAKLKAAQDMQKSYADVRRKDLKEIGPVAYKIDLLEELSRVHNVVYISMLRKYISNALHVFGTLEIELRDNMSYEEQPMQILGKEKKRLLNKTIPLVKVLWRNHLVEEAILE
ncbi:uncharacterized protein LOC132804487 [Ziziphus jujuba]|uniref:Uncharacterized protein LOC132804487 n=1 Tax=Ziziphus jujuba TaxID=326968 RepID=A0ABM4ADS5_ZIZJJ|nr:uncharacterized protein LOC132804487 [Ziziphus jujuba]